MSLLAPGVHRERADEQPAAHAVRCDIAAFVGIARRGPIATPIAVESWREFEACFGSIDAPGHLPRAVRGFFENGGARCHVVRVADATAVSTASITIVDVNGNPAVVLGASSPGAWGNELAVRLTEVRRVRRSIDASASDHWSVAVDSIGGFEPGAVVELRGGAGPAPLRVVDEVRPATRSLVLDRPVTTPELAAATSVERVTARVDVRAGGRLVASYDDLSASSRDRRAATLVLPGDVAGAAARGLAIPLVSWTPLGAPTDTPVRWQSTGWEPLAGGADGLASLAGTDLIAGIDALVDVEEVAIVAVPDTWNPVPPVPPIISPRCTPDPCAAPGALGTEVVDRGDTPRRLIAAESQRVQQALVEHCDSLADRVAVLDPPPQIADAVIGRDVLLQWRLDTSSSYATTYTPWLKVADPAGGSTIATPPCGHVCGQMARNDAVRGVHHAPANTVVDWAADWSVEYGADDHALLNDEGINVLRAGLDGVLRIGGARTLSAEPAVRFLNVRRLLIFVERSLRRSLAWCVHEPNDHATRAKVQLCATTLLRALFERGAFVGATPDDAFAVRCDEGNNPPEARANGALHLDIALAPSTPMEVILLRIGRVEGSLDLAVTELSGGGLWPR